MISVVIVSFHTGPVLWRSIASALSEADEVIVVDNGNPPDVAERLQRQARDEARLTVLRGHGNVGFAKACNLGASAARGDLLLFLNPDAVLPQDAAAGLTAPGRKGGYTHWATGPKLVNPDGSEQRGSRRAVLTPWNAFVEATRLYLIAPKHPAFARFNTHELPALDRPTPVPCLSGACFLTPRETWEALGGMDERFFLHVEDVDFFVRLHKLKGTAIYVPSVAVVHEKSSSDADPLEIERRKKQSMNLYFSTHFADVYPPGFLSLLRGMLWTSFLFRSLTIRSRRLFR